MVFELACGEYLFDPHSGSNYSRDEGAVTPLLYTLVRVLSLAFYCIAQLIFINFRAFDLFMRPIL